MNFYNINTLFFEYNDWICYTEYAHSLKGWENESKKIIRYLSWIATGMSILMYVSYIPQIADNLAGSKGNPIQPFVAAVNCLLWVIYGLGKKPRDFALATVNFPGIIFGIVAFVTAL